MRLTLQTDVLFETGEGEATRGLAEYLGLLSDVDAAPSVAPLTYCGMVVAFAATGVMAGSHLFPKQVAALVTSGHAAALGLLAFAWFYTLKHRPRLFGLRLIASGAYLSSLPFVVAVFRTLMRP